MTESKNTVTCHNCGAECSGSGIGILAIPSVSEDKYNELKAINIELAEVLALMLANTWEENQTGLIKNLRKRSNDILDKHNLITTNN